MAEAHISKAELERMLEEAARKGAREAIIEVESERWGPIKMQNCFPKFSATPTSVRTAAPSRIGQHNAEVYGELLGLNDTDLDRLGADGLI